MTAIRFAVYVMAGKLKRDDRFDLVSKLEIEMIFRNSFFNNQPLISSAADRCACAMTQKNPSSVI
jgi:hypothetical protein